MIPGSDSDHPSFLKSFLFAVQGFRFAVRSERNIKVMLCGGALAVVAELGHHLPLLRRRDLRRAREHRHRDRR